MCRPYRPLTLLLAGLGAATLVACGDGDASPTDTTSNNGFVDRDTNPPDAGSDGVTPDSGLSDVEDAASDQDVPSDEDVPSNPADVSTDGATDSASDDVGPSFDPGPPEFGTPTPPGTSRGHQWVANNRPFVSGLSVSVDNVTAAHRTAYFDEFGATAAHLWELGLPDRAEMWRNGGEHRFLTWTHGDGTVVGTGGQILGGYPANRPGRIGYQIGDEPGNIAAYNEIVGGLNAARSVDPAALYIINFSFWADDLNTMLNRYGADGFDILSYDLYSRRSSEIEAAAKFRAAAIDNGTPYWRYLKSYAASGDDPTEYMAASDIRWDAYLGLTFGYTGHTWFLYQINNGDSLQSGIFTGIGHLDHPRRPAFGTIATLNRELVQVTETTSQLVSTDVRYQPFFDYDYWYAFLADLGVAESDLPAAARTAAAEAQPDGTEPWSAGAGGDPFLTAVEPGDIGGNMDILVGFFRDGNGETYVMVQNLNHDNGGELTGTTAGVVELDFDFAGADDVSRDHLVALDASDGNLELLRLTRTGPTTSHLSLPLQAGMGKLFKYHTGAPFARRAGTF